MAKWPSGMYYIEYQTEYGETPDEIYCDANYFISNYLPTLNYPGKKFLGWSLSPNGTDLIKVNDEIYEEWFAPESIVLYAVWGEEEETVEFIVKSNKIYAIADAIRNKLNITDQMLIDDMPQKIKAIVTGNSEVCDIIICHDYSQYYGNMEIIYLDKNSQVQTLRLGYGANLSDLIKPLKNSIFIIKLLTPPGACPQGKMTWYTSCNLYDKNNNFLNTSYDSSTNSLNINIPLVFQALGNDNIIFGSASNVPEK